MIVGPTRYLSERVGETRVTLADVTRAKDELCWEAGVRLEDYLKNE